MSTIDRLAAERDAMTAWLRQVTADPAAAPVLRAAGRRLGGRRRSGWDACVAEVRRLWTLRPDATRYAALHDRLAAVSPAVGGRVDRGEAPAVGAERACGPGSGGGRRPGSTSVVGGVDPAVLGRAVERARDKIRRLTGDLVVASAWLEVALALDDRRRAALADWTTALRKIGKGTGQDRRALAGARPAGDGVGGRGRAGLGHVGGPGDRAVRRRRATSTW